MLKSVKGQILVETCLIIPVLIFLISFIIQVALIFNSYMLANYASFAACRAGMSYFNVNKDSRAYSNAKKAARIVLLPDSVSSALLADIKVEKIGNDIAVKITYPMPLIFNLRRFFPYAMLTTTCRMPMK